MVPNFSQRRQGRKAQKEGAKGSIRAPPPGRKPAIGRTMACAVCGEHPTITKLIDYEQFCGIVPEPELGANPDEVTVQEMKKALDHPALGIKVVDVREPDEYEIARCRACRCCP
jgi:adenylyltransferase/sulfurtransferase